VGAAAGVDGNFAQAFGTFLGGGVGRFFTFVHAGHERVDRSDYEKVDGGGDQEERDAGVDELANRERNAVNSKCEAGKIAVLADECSD